MSRVRWALAGALTVVTFVAATKTIGAYHAQEMTLGLLVVVCLTLLLVAGLGSLGWARLRIQRELVALRAGSEASHLLSVRRARLRQIHAAGIRPDRDTLAEVARSGESSRAYFGRYLVATTVLMGLVGTFVGLMQILGRLAPLLADKEAAGLAMLAAPLAGLHVTFGASLVAILATLALALAQGDLVVHEEQALAVLEDLSTHQLIPSLWPPAEEATERTARAVGEIKAAVTDALARSITTVADSLADAGVRQQQALSEATDRQAQSLAKTSAAAGEQLGAAATTVMRQLKVEIEGALARATDATRTGMAAVVTATETALALAAEVAGDNSRRTAAAVETLAGVATTALEDSTARTSTAVEQLARQSASTLEEATRGATASLQASADRSATQLEESAGRLAVLLEASATRSAATADRLAASMASAQDQSAVRVEALLRKSTDETAASLRAVATTTEASLSAAAASTEASLSAAAASAEASLSAAAASAEASLSAAAAATAAAARTTSEAVARTLEPLFATEGAHLDGVRVALRQAGDRLEVTTKQLDGLAASLDGVAQAHVAALDRNGQAVLTALEQGFFTGGKALNGAASTLGAAAQRLQVGAETLGPRLAALTTELGALGREVALLVAARGPESDVAETLLGEIDRLGAGLERLLDLARETRESPPVTGESSEASSEAILVIEAGAAAAADDGNAAGIPIDREASALVEVVLADAADAPDTPADAPTSPDESAT